MNAPAMLPIERWVFDNTIVRWVCGGSRSAPVAYTAGYWAEGLPELVVVGLNDRQSTTLLNTYGARQKERGAAWVPGDLDRELYTLPTKFGDVNDAWIEQWMTLSFERHAAGGQVVQLLWPDRRGIFPDEPGFSTEFKHQTVLA